MTDAEKSFWIFCVKQTAPKSAVYDCGKLYLPIKNDMKVSNWEKRVYPFGKPNKVTLIIDPIQTFFPLWRRLGYYTRYFKVVPDHLKKDVSWFPEYHVGWLIINPGLLDSDPYYKVIPRRILKRALATVGLGRLKK